MDRKISIAIVGIIVTASFMPVATAWPLFQNYSVEPYTFPESKLRTYLPVITNDILPDKIYARAVESTAGTAYCYMLYWRHQDGFYGVAEHEQDWEWIVVYTKPNGQVYQVNYDSYHYYIGREYEPSVWGDTHVLLFVDDAYHYYRPDLQFRFGNISRQLNQTLVECTGTILFRAQQEVSFDPEMFDDPFAWQDMGWFGRYTAFDSWWKAFLVVSDKTFDWIDFEDINNWWTQLLGD